MMENNFGASWFWEAGTTAAAAAAVFIVVDVAAPILLGSASRRRRRGDQAALCPVTQRELFAVLRTCVRANASTSVSGDRSELGCPAWLGQIRSLAGAAESR